MQKNQQKQQTKKFVELFLQHNFNFGPIRGGLPLPGIVGVWVPTMDGDEIPPPSGKRSETAGSQAKSMTRAASSACPFLLSDAPSCFLVATHLLLETSSHLLYSPNFLIYAPCLPLFLPSCLISLHLHVLSMNLSRDDSTRWMNF